jgi:hypothetical protein
MLREILREFALLRLDFACLDECRFERLSLREGEPILTVFSETLANDFECVVNVRKYVAAITRYASGRAVTTPWE